MITREIESMLSLFREQNYHELYRMWESMADVDGLPQALGELGGMHCCTEKYEQLAAELICRSEGVSQRLMSMLTGGQEYKCSPIHSTYYNELMARSHSLKCALTSITAQGADLELCSDIAYSAVLLLLTKNESKFQQGSYWMKVAAEQLALPLIEFVTDNRIEVLYEYYKRALGKSRPLPSQKMLLTEIKKRLYKMN